MNKLFESHLFFGKKNCNNYDFGWLWAGPVKDKFRFTVDNEGYFFGLQFG